jgi:hypothetical protein
LRHYPGSISSDAKQDRLYKFFTTLNSIKNLNVNNSSFYLKIDDDFQFAIPRIKDFIKENFENSKLEFDRIDTFDGWKKVFEQVTEDQILWLTYDDHAYVPIDNLEFNRLRQVLYRADELLPQSIIFGDLSHFPEKISGFEYFKALKTMHKIDDYLLIPNEKPLGVVIVNTKKLQNNWKFDFTNGNKIVSPENPFGPSFVAKGGLGIIPRNELFRHLDGYNHISLSSPFEAILMPDSNVNEKINEFKFQRINKYNNKSLHEELSILNSENCLHISKLNLSTNRMIIANSRRITLLGSKYTFKNIDIELKFKLLGFINALINSKIIRLNLLYLPIDFLTVLFLRGAIKFKFIENTNNSIGRIIKIFK